MAGLERVVCNYADDVAKYLRCYNKYNGTKYTSILQTKPFVKGGEFKPMLQRLETDVFTSSGTKNFASRIKRLSTPEYESKTLQRLYTPEFKPTRRIDENGYFVTTVINKQTQKPAEIFIKETGLGHYHIFEKGVNGTYNKIGSRDFEINQALRQLDPGYMSSSANEVYSGIGIRCHQLAVENAIKYNCDKIYLNSLDSALPFHLKSLFKPAQSMKISADYFDGLVGSVMEQLSISKEKALKLLSYSSKNNVYTLNWGKSFEQLNQFAIKNSKPTVGNASLLSLEGETLELWKDMARSQPILL